MHQQFVPTQQPCGGQTKLSYGSTTRQCFHTNSQVLLDASPFHQIVLFRCESPLSSEMKHTNQPPLKISRFHLKRAYAGCVRCRGQVAAPACAHHFHFVKVLKFKSSHNPRSALTTNPRGHLSRITCNLLNGLSREEILLPLGIIHAFAVDIRDKPLGIHRPDLSGKDSETTSSKLDFTNEDRVPRVRAGRRCRNVFRP